MKFLLCISLSVTLLAAGCGKATYPKERLRESIIKVCNDEYNMDVAVDIAGKTLIIYLPLMNLFDLTLSLSENAQEKIQNVLLSASRVALSTDAEINFYCIIAQDTRFPEIQLIIIKYVDDVKRAFFQDISRGEYFKRTLIDINENPQAKKEQAIVNVFKKMELGKEWQERVMDDFFRSPPSSLEGIGYWQGKFYIKDIALEEFLASQMANRIKMRFREKEPLRKYALKSVTGRFVAENNLKIFFIAFRAESLLFAANPEEKASMAKEVFANVFEEASNVIYGYKFEDFDSVKIIEENYDEKLLVSEKDVYLFKKGKIGINDILKAVSP